ncbi:unnamed protein product, partial [Iphiclides podalirius]
MLGFLDIFNDQARQLVEDLKVEVGRAPFDHDPYIRRTAMEAICCEKFKPFLDLLFELNDSNGKEAFSEQEIREHVDTFIVAGHDTVAGTLVFTLLLIGSYPEVQEKICEEHPIWGENPEQFKPERWLQQSTLPENTNAFVAFGLGRRVCIARPYAMFIMKTIISHVLRHYRVSGDHLKMVNTFDCLLKTATGHYIILRAKNSLRYIRNCESKYIIKD